MKLCILISLHRKVYISWSQLKYMCKVCCSKWFQHYLVSVMCNHSQYKAVNTRSFLVPGSEVHILTFGVLSCSWLYRHTCWYSCHIDDWLNYLWMCLTCFHSVCRTGLVPITSAKYQLNCDIITKAVLNQMVTTSRLATSGKKTTFEYIKILMLTVCYFSVTFCFMMSLRPAEETELIPWCHQHLCHHTHSVWWDNFLLFWGYSWGSYDVSSLHTIIC